MNIVKSIEFKVGLMVLVVASLVAFMSIQVSERQNYFGSARSIWFLAGNANGLIKNSAVKMAGIPIGMIEDITLSNGVARIDIVVRGDVKLTTSSKVSITSVGILGDKQVEISPGNPLDPELKNGDQLLEVSDKGSIDKLIAEVSEITGSIKNVAKALEKAVDGQGDESSTLGRIVKNLERITSDISEITNDNKKELKDIVTQVNNITRSLDDFLNSDDPDNFKQVWAKASRGLDSLEVSLANLEDVSKKINEGEGTVAKLINDEETAEDVASAIEGINEYISAADRIQTSLDFHTTYLGQLEQFKSFIGIQIQPGLDRFYEIQVVDDPSGVVKETDTTTTVNNGPETTVSETKTHKNEVKFSLLFAKRFFNFTVKGGLIENVGGVSFNYHLLNDDLLLNADLFDFGELNLRPSIQYNIYRGVYVLGGVNDALNNSQARSDFFGAGILLTNDDLKLLVSGMAF